MTTSHYSTIRFIGYVIPTTPANMVAIANPNTTGSVGGTYLGNEDLAADIAARVAVLKNAVDTAKAALPPDQGGGVINLFMAPEFFFHGVQGPYVYASGATDPVETIQTQLAAAFPASEYPNWTFVFGSAITAKADNMDHIYASTSVSVRNAVVKTLAEQWLAAFGPLQGVIFDMLVNFIKNCHSYPNLEVRNRAMIISNIPLDTPATAIGTDRMTIEKYYVSNEDFILYDVSGKQNVVTEQMTAYPHIDLSGGDLKTSAFDKHAIFRQNYGGQNHPSHMDFGVEICLDHGDLRLRRNIDKQPFPEKGDSIHVHLIPSCGTQIGVPSVAAGANGFVFNCDGQYALDSSNGTAQQGYINNVPCVYANYVDLANTNINPYAGHTQLARVQTAATGGDPNAKTSTNATFIALPATDIAIIAVPPPATCKLEDYFAGGPGEVHIYGLKTPYTLHPTV